MTTTSHRVPAFVILSKKTRRRPAGGDCKLTPAQTALLQALSARMDATHALDVAEDRLETERATLAGFESGEAGATWPPDFVTWAMTRMRREIARLEKRVAPLEERASLARLELHATKRAAGIGAQDVDPRGSN